MSGRHRKPTTSSVSFAKVAFTGAVLGGGSIALAGQALANRQALGAVLWGEAGIGKSHLLARLERWAAGNGKPDGGRAIFILLSNLQSRPEALPRTSLLSQLGDNQQKPDGQAPK